MQLLWIACAVACLSNNRTLLGWLVVCTTLKMKSGVEPKHLRTTQRRHHRVGWDSYPVLHSRPQLTNRTRMGKTSTWMAPNGSLTPQAGRQLVPLSSFAGETIQHRRFTSEWTASEACLHGEGPSLDIRWTPLLILQDMSHAFSRATNCEVEKVVLSFFLSLDVIVPCLSSLMER